MRPAKLATAALYRRDPRGEIIKRLGQPRTWPESDRSHPLRPRRKPKTSRVAAAAQRQRRAAEKRTSVGINANGRHRRAGTCSVTAADCLATRW